MYPSKYVGPEARIVQHRPSCTSSRACVCCSIRIISGNIILDGLWEHHFSVFLRILFQRSKTKQSTELRIEDRLLKSVVQDALSTATARLLVVRPTPSSAVQTRPCSALGRRACAAAGPSALAAPPLRGLMKAEAHKARRHARVNLFGQPPSCAAFDVCTARSRHPHHDPIIHSIQCQSDTTLAFKAEERPRERVRPNRG